MTKPLSDVELLVASTILSIGSLLFIVLLLVSYFSKEKVSSVRNKLYKYMLIVNFILIVTELVEVLVITYLDNYSLLFLSFKLHWATGIFWFSGLYYYSVVFMDGIESNKMMDVIKYNKYTKIMTGFFVIFGIVYLFVPFDFSLVTKSYMTYFPGMSSTFVYVFCAIADAAIVIHLISNRRKVDFRKRLAVWIMIVELLAIFGLQIIYPYIAFLAIGASIQMFFLYFNVENPDLFMIAELEKNKSKIDKSNKAKTDFLSNMSYEIKNPMQEIMEYSHSLTESNFEEEKVRTTIKNIVLSSNSLLDTVNNILDISKIESGEETLELREYSIANIVMELSSIVDARLYGKKVNFIVNVDPNTPAKLYGDSTKLLQILLNVLTNSIKYTDVGKIRLVITSDIVGSNALLHIKVSDSGCGIPTEKFAQIQNMFSKLDKEFEADLGGNGLGLAITKKYVDLMDGTFKIESEYRAGTTVYIDISQRIISPEKVGSIYKPVGEANGIIDCTGLKILLVDNNKLNLLVTSKLFSKYKFDVDSVDNSKDCIYKIKAENHYDLIFLDHMMPEMDGIEVLHILRKLEGYDLPPIICLTANAITGMKEMYLKEGFDDYLSKPINVRELENIIIKYLGDKIKK